jgi:hypothetical protein
MQPDVPALLARPNEKTKHADPAHPIRLLRACNER